VISESVTLRILRDPAKNVFSDKKRPGHSVTRQ
jgi:hypothetical protein